METVFRSTNTTCLGFSPAASECSRCISTCRRRQAGAPLSPRQRELSPQAFTWGLPRPPGARGGGRKSVPATLPVCWDGQQRPANRSSQLSSAGRDDGRPEEASLLTANTPSQSPAHRAGRRNSPVQPWKRVPCFESRFPGLAKHDVTPSHLLHFTLQLKPQMNNCSSSLHSQLD